MRGKRSIDMLGSAIKFVTGNLDAEDLSIINNNLDELRKSENTLIKQNNRQIKVNTKFENRINLINNEIKNHQNTLHNILIKDEYILSEHQKLLIIFQMDSFLETLKSIEYSIMLAKLNIVSKFVLTPKEIEIIAQEIRNQNLEIYNIDDASNYLSTTVIYKGPILIISVNIPRLLNTSFKKAIIEPLPRSNHTVKITHKTVFINKDQILAIKSKCQETQKVTICERKQLIDISNDSCEAPLLRGHHGKCNLLEMPPTLEIRTIAQGTLLVSTVHQDVTINSTCSIAPEKLIGIHLINFHNCSIYVGNQLYENYELRFYQPIILPLQFMKIKPLQIERHVNLTELHIRNLETLQKLERIDWKHLSTSISIITILLLGLLVFGISKYRQHMNTANCSGRAILKGGRLKDGSDVTPNIPITVPTPAQRTGLETARSAVTNIGPWTGSIAGTNVTSTGGARSALYNDTARAVSSSNHCCKSFGLGSSK